MGSNPHTASIKMVINQKPTHYAIQNMTSLRNILPLDCVSFCVSSFFSGYCSFKALLTTEKVNDLTELGTLNSFYSD